MPLSEVIDKIILAWSRNPVDTASNRYIYIRPPCPDTKTHCLPGDLLSRGEKRHTQTQVHLEARSTTGKRLASEITCTRLPASFSVCCFLCSGSFKITHRQTKQQINMSAWWWQTTPAGCVLMNNTSGSAAQSSWTHTRCHLGTLCKLKYPVVNCSLRKCNVQSSVVTQTFNYTKQIITMLQEKNITKVHHFSI